MTTEWTTRHLQLPLQYDEKLIQKYANDRVYRNVVALTPGSYVDHLSNTTADFSKSLLIEKAYNWEKNNHDTIYLDLDHDIYHCLSRIGFVEPVGWGNGAVRVNIRIPPITQNAKDIIALIDAKIIDGVSVEIRTKEEWNHDNRTFNIKDIVFTGLGLVTEPACKDARIQ